VRFLSFRWTRGISIPHSGGVHRRGALAMAMMAHNGGDRMARAGGGDGMARSQARGRKAPILAGS
jgi:hypothetical protein